MSQDNEQIAGNVRSLSENIVPEDVELVDVKVAGGGPARKVSVIIGKRGGMPIDEITDVARKINKALDELAGTKDDPVPGGFTLEVTTPGLSWPLRNRKDFYRVGDYPVRVISEDGTEAEGSIGDLTDTHVTIETEGGSVVIAYDDIKSAKQVLPF